MVSGATQTQPDTATADASAKVKIQIQIPDQAIKSGRIIIKDGQVYVRIGTEKTMSSGAVKAVVLTSKCVPHGPPYSHIMYCGPHA